MWYGRYLLDSLRVNRIAIVPYGVIDHSDGISQLSVTFQLLRANMGFGGADCKCLKLMVTIEVLGMRVHVDVS